MSSRVFVPEEGSRERSDVSSSDGCRGEMVAGVRGVVTVLVGCVVGLTFLFGFGNVLDLGLRLGVSPWVAPLVAPAVDASVVALLLGSRELALRGAGPRVLEPVRRLLMFTSVVTLALNTAEPLIAGEWGKAAFDAVGPLLLIGWAEVGPGLLQALSGSSTSDRPPEAEAHDRGETTPAKATEVSVDNSRGGRDSGDRRTSSARHDQLLIAAREADAEHRAVHLRPVSAETLRKRLQIAAATSRALVATVRREYSAPVQRQPSMADSASYPDAA